MRIETKPKILTVTTPERSGKTLCALNLAFTLAQLRHRTLLVDLDPMGRLTHALDPNPQSYNAAGDLTLHRTSRLGCSTVDESLAQVLFGGAATPRLVGPESWERDLDNPLQLLLHRPSSGYMVPQVQRMACRNSSPPWREFVGWR